MEINECVELGFDNTYIVLKNKCSDKIYVARVEIVYYVTAFPGEPEVGERARRVRRRIEERIRVERSIEPKGVVKVYFGPTENIEEVWVIAGPSNKDLRKVKVK